MAMQDDRIRAALVLMLEDDPVNGARCLAELGDRRGVADLASALDRLLLAPIADCDVCAGEHLRAIASAVRVLGGSLSEEQRAKIDHVLERAEAQWVRFEDPLASPRVLRALDRRDARPGRNDPCHAISKPTNGTRGTEAASAARARSANPT